GTGGFPRPLGPGREQRLAAEIAVRHRRVADGVAGHDRLPLGLPEQRPLVEHATALRALAQRHQFAMEATLLLWRQRQPVELALETQDIAVLADVDALLRQLRREIR